MNHRNGTDVVKLLREELRALRGEIERKPKPGFSAMGWGVTAELRFSVFMLEPLERFDVQEKVIVSGPKTDQDLAERMDWYALFDRAGELCREAITRLAKPVTYAPFVLNQDHGGLHWVAYLVTGIRGVIGIRHFESDGVTEWFIIECPRESSLRAIDNLLHQLPLCDSPVGKPTATAIMDAYSRATGTSEERKAAVQPLIAASNYASFESAKSVAHREGFKLKSNKKK